MHKSGRTFLKRQFKPLLPLFVGVYLAGVCSYFFLAHVIDGYQLLSNLGSILMFVFIYVSIIYSFKYLKLIYKLMMGFFVLIIAENGSYPPTKNGDVRSLFCLFSLMA
ncbi:hypothetical protein, partial [Acetoanaerobium noterae]|uniref:hypothetical protein n=1 Tax=Acetoanaerobium noterae TaxID=745369 RepID=UPI003222122C